ncbi:Gfo/Idh/MocA family protein [Erythrobacter sp.]|jgi:predicted dehydrogenase|uniref:Gfo/Idh/MocA family protein n=1 Tax=Erythrobacter sp. TaxID=1042 RepID=UPI002EAF28DB|nr:Gfo/Idh/MocA family oxidoreductase [Erythrobacter sp.]
MEQAGATKCETADDGGDSQLVFGVIGCGQIGRRHLAAIAQEPRSQALAVCDIDADALERAGAALPHLECFHDLRDLLAMDEIDIVSICTPHRSHSEIAIAAAQSGKDALVEKPMALNEADARRMIDAAQENGTRLIVVKQNRFNAPVEIVARALEEKRLGRIYMVQCNVFWNRYPGYYAGSPWRGTLSEEQGALHTQVSHFIDLLVWWLGPLRDARTITGTLHHDIEIEDCGVSALRFESGTIGSLNWSTAVYNVNYEGSITIIGEKGTIKIGGRYLNQIEFWDVESYPQPAIDGPPDKPNDYGGYMGSAANHGRLFHEVARHVIEARGGIVEGDEGMLTVSAIERIYDGAR